MRARWRAGFQTKGQYRHYGYDSAVLHSGEVHEMANHRALVGRLGIATVHPPAIPKEVFADIDHFPAKRVILHAWSGGFQGHYKQWPMERWVELARRLVAAGYGVELSGAPSDREKSKALMQELSNAGVAVLDQTGKFNLFELARRLRASHAVIAVDTGIMHLAAAVGILTIGLHGPSPARRWGAVGARAYHIESPCPGCGFLDLGFEYPKTVPPCMEAITVDRVWDEFQLRSVGK
jgi:heptosyltransferase I